MFVHAWEQVLSLRRLSTTPSNKYSILNIVYDIYFKPTFLPVNVKALIHLWYFYKILHETRIAVFV